ncbi:MAG: hypothetical protein CL916_12925 [Deltaproteobacteria bacterium]|nr:hypothetical protein [Deltaproteobacteria bacterium]
MSLIDLGVLQVEPTDQCNLRCTMCAPHYEGWETVHAIPKGNLSVDLWEQILKGFVQDDIRFDHIIFQWLGDPLVHPRALDIMLMAAKTMQGRVQYLRLDSNCILLNEKRVQALCSMAVTYSVPILLVCTLDAHTPQVYEDVKGARQLLRVRKNIHTLLRTRKKYGERCLLNVQIQFVVQQGNAHECHSFLHYWRFIFDDYGGLWHDELMFKRLSVGGGSKGQAQADQLYEESIHGTGIRHKEYGNLHVLCWKQRPWQNDDQHQEERKPCPGLWLTPVIRHDGSLMMCCADLGGTLQLGSLKSHRFSQLWFGKEANRHRKNHMEGIFTDACLHCGGINWYTLTDEVVAHVDDRSAELLLDPE